MIFECEEVEGTDKRGVVRARGVEWTEARVWTEWMLISVAMLFFGVGLLGAIATVLGGLAVGGKFGVPAGMLTLAVFGAGYGLRHLQRTWEGKKANLLFSEEGWITSSWEKNWVTTVADIRSIEAVQLKPKEKDDVLEYTHGVRLIRRRGKPGILASNLQPDQAMELAVMLNEALEAVKYGPSRAATEVEPALVY